MDSPAPGIDAPVPFVRREREALADDLVGFGPDAPTILDGWSAAELLEHLLVREHGVLAAAAARSPLAPLRRRGQEALASFAELTWAQQVAIFRAGHRRLSPLHAADRAMNTVEYLVHHEDLRRARPGWEPRALPEADDREVWKHLGLMSRLLIRAGVDVVLVGPSGGLRVPARGGESHGSVRVHGAPTELLLWAFGRDRVARVRLEGEADALLALREADRGF